MKIKSRVRAEDGFLSRVEITSEKLGGIKAVFAIFLPDSCTDEKKLPVVYYLSGLMCTEADICQKGAVFRAACDNEVVLVMPDTSPRGEGIPDEQPKEFYFGVGAGFYLTATTDKYRNHFNMYEYILEELPDFVEKHFPVSNKRAIMGHQMGGHGALTIALKNPDRYEAVSALAPICNPSAVLWGRKAFSQYLGDDESTWKEYDATELIKKYVGKKDLHILCDQGLADKWLESLLTPEPFITAAQEAGVPISFHMREDYDHSYYFVSSFIREHLAHHASFLHADIPEVSQMLDDALAIVSDGTITVTEDIFNRFDIDRVGVLDGDQYCACIDALLADMKWQCKRELRRLIQREKDEGKFSQFSTDQLLSQVFSKRLSDSRLRTLVTKMADPNNDGKIKKKEAPVGFKEASNIEEDIKKKEDDEADAPLNDEEEAEAPLKDDEEADAPPNAEEEADAPPTNEEETKAQPKAQEEVNVQQKDDEAEVPPKAQENAEAPPKAEEVRFPVLQKAMEDLDDAIDKVVDHAIDKAIRQTPLQDFMDDKDDGEEPTPKKMKLEA